jgi:hypothetical protein
MADFISERETPDPAGDALISAWNYWERKGRFRSNLIVGGTGALIVIYFFNSFPNELLWGVFFWGLIANAFYSLGYVAESYLIMKDAPKASLVELRLALFWVGTLTSVCINYAIVGSIYLSQSLDRTRLFG